MTILVSLLFAIAGALMLLVCANPKLVRLGEITYLCGLLVFLMQLSPKVIELFGR